MSNELKLCFVGWCWVGDGGRVVLLVPFGVGVDSFFFLLDWLYFTSSILIELCVMCVCRRYQELEASK